jgi:hypothetical protein
MGFFRFRGCQKNIGNGKSIVASKHLAKFQHHHAVARMSSSSPRIDSLSRDFLSTWFSA